METITPAEVVIKPGEMTTEGPVFLVFVKTEDANTFFYFSKKQHEDWVSEILYAMDNPGDRTVQVELGSAVHFGGFHRAENLKVKKPMKS